MISIVASKALVPTPELVAVIAGLVASAQRGEPIGLRVNASDEPASPCEYLAWIISRSVGRSTFKFKAEQSRKVFQRDYLLAEKSRVIVAFFQPGLEMSGGTGHVVKAALDRGIPVEAYTFDEFGELFLLGSDPGSQVRSRPDALRQIMGFHGA